MSKAANANKSPYESSKLAFDTELSPSRTLPRIAVVSSPDISSSSPVISFEKKFSVPWDNRGAPWPPPHLGVRTELIPLVYSPVHSPPHGTSTGYFASQGKVCTYMTRNRDVMRPSFSFPAFVPVSACLAVARYLRSRPRTWCCTWSLSQVHENRSVRVVFKYPRPSQQCTSMG